MAKAQLPADAQASRRARHEVTLVPAKCCYKCHIAAIVCRRVAKLMSTKSGICGFKEDAYERLNAVWSPSSISPPNRASTNESLFGTLG